MTDFRKDLFMKRVVIKASGKTGTIIDIGSVEGAYIVEVDSPDKGDVYPLRDCRLDELSFEPEAMVV